MSIENNVRRGFLLYAIISKHLLNIIITAMNVLTLASYEKQEVLSIVCAVKITPELRWASFFNRSWAFVAI